MHMGTVIGFFLAILTLIVSEHFKRYIRIVNSLANITYYLNIYHVSSKRAIDLHHQKIEEKKDYIMLFNNSEISEYFKYDVTSILLVKNKILTNTVLKAINRIEEFNKLIKNKNQYCVLSMMSKKENIREYNTNHLIYESFSDEVLKYKNDLPILIKDALESINKILNINLLRRYYEIMWKNSQPEFPEQ